MRYKYEQLLHETRAVSKCGGTPNYPSLTARNKDVFGEKELVSALERRVLCVCVCFPIVSEGIFFPTEYAYINRARSKEKERNYLPDYREAR